MKPEPKTYRTSEILQMLIGMNRHSRKIFIKQFKKEDQTKLLRLFESYRKNPDAFRFGDETEKAEEGEQDVTPTKDV